MKLLIIGGSGYVGQYLCKYLNNIIGNDFEIYSTYNNTNIFNDFSHLFPNVKKSFKIDFLSNNCEIFNLLKDLKPDFIINTSAMSAVLQCQENPENAFKINDPSWWAKESILNGCKRFIHFSTDMVYRGNNAPYKEDDESNPIPSMIYGLSKKKGEENLLNKIPVTILRSALVIGPPSITGKGRGSCLDWIKNSLEKSSPENPVKFFDNEERSPLLVYDMVKVCGEIILKHNDIPNSLILNVGGDSDSSRYEIGKSFAERLGISNNNYIAIHQEPLSGGVERPLHLQMSNLKLKNILNINMCTLEQSMDIIFNLQNYPFFLN